MLSSAVAKQIHKNIAGLTQIPGVKAFAEEILHGGSCQKIANTRYTNDKQITDHYAIIPTGQGMGAMRSLNTLSRNVYETIVRRFLAIFYPPAVYLKYQIVFQAKQEQFFCGFKVLKEQGYLPVMEYSFFKKKEEDSVPKDIPEGETELAADEGLLAAAASWKKGMVVPGENLWIKEGETSPPKRYHSGSMILAMENAGQLIEDEDLRATIKGSGIGTSATRAEILAKLVRIQYLGLNKKTQMITPTLLGELIFDVVGASIKSLLNPELTASWEKGLTYVAEGSITPEEYMVKLEHFIRSRTGGVMNLNNQYLLRQVFDQSQKYYKTNEQQTRKKETSKEISKEISGQKQTRKTQVQQKQKQVNSG